MGRIINIASIAGKEGNPKAVPYSATKAGVIGLTKSVGKELATTGIRVNCITPAVVRTRILEQLTQEHIDYMISKIPMASHGRGGGGGGAGRVAGVGGVLVQHGRGFRHQRRAGDVLMGSATMKGLFPILATPFDGADLIDEEDLRREVDFVIENGVHGVGIAFASEVVKLSEAERDVATRTVVEQAAGRVHPWW